MRDGLVKVIEGGGHIFIGHPQTGEPIQLAADAKADILRALSALPPLRAREEIAREFEEAREFVRNLWRNNDVGQDQHYEIIARLDELEKSLSSTAGQEWRDISSAPKEPMDEHAYGPTILLWADGTVGVGFWDYDFRKFYVEYPEGGSQPTHWMPLPAPPVAEPIVAEKQTGTSP